MELLIVIHQKGIIAMTKIDVLSKQALFYNFVLGVELIKVWFKEFRLLFDRFTVIAFEAIVHFDENLCKLEIDNS